MSEKELHVLIDDIRDFHVDVTLHTYDNAMTEAYI